MILLHLLYVIFYQINVSLLCSRYDTKLHWVVRLQFYSSDEFKVTTSWLLLPGSLWPMVVVSVKVSFKVSE